MRVITGIDKENKIKYKHSKTKIIDIYEDYNPNAVEGVEVEDSIITNRLDVAQTTDTTLTPEEEEMFARAAKASKEDNEYLKKRWIQFKIMLGLMIAGVAGFFIYVMTHAN